VIYPEQRPPDRGKPAFSLIEMVTVIAILVILMTAGISLLSGTGSQARKAGTDTLTGMIEQARTSAITSRCYVVLAIAEPGDLPAGDERCRLGLFKVAMDKWPANPADTIEAVLMSRWRTLETGVAIIGEKVDGVENPLDADELTISYGANKPLTVNVHAIAFNPRGGLHYPSGSTPVAMRIAEGNYQNRKATPFKRGDAGVIAENRLKIGRVIARPYRTDG
jgi:prepilin-type N-terminal cleavage/methylation domain-containing protein